MLGTRGEGGMGECWRGKVSKGNMLEEGKRRREHVVGAGG